MEYIRAILDRVGYEYKGPILRRSELIDAFAGVLVEILERLDTLEKNNSGKDSGGGK